MATEPEITPGFPEVRRQEVSALYWAAFQAKLGRVMGPEVRALAFLACVADPAPVLSARAPDGTTLGIAGFKTAAGAFIGGTAADRRAVYGGFGGMWRGVLLSTLERPVEPDTLLMDGIAVSPAARGQGIGAQLLAAIRPEAAARGCRTLRLDVIDTNPRARALYERLGFTAQRTERTGLLRCVFGFRASTTMTLPV